MRHTLSWFAWTLCAAAAALLVRNPLYLILIALAVWSVYQSIPAASAMASTWRGFLKIGLGIWLITVPFNALMVHQGRIILFRLPSSWPLIGGPITLEAILSGIVSGFGLWLLLFIFSTFNLAVDASRLLRFVPPFLYHAGVITSIAMTFIPRMISNAVEIREAQRIRGHRFRGLRDLLPLLIPLLTTAFEDAVQLAESMEARGFGGEATTLTPKRMRVLRLLLVLGLLLFLLGFVWRVFDQRAIVGNALLGGALLSLGYAFYELGRHVRRTRYRQEHWQAADLGGVISGALVLATVLWARWAMPAQLSFSPYAPGGLHPAFHIGIGLMVTLLAIPAWLNILGQEDQNHPPNPLAEDTP